MEPGSGGEHWDPTGWEEPKVSGVTEGWDEIGDLGGLVRQWCMEWTGVWRERIKGTRFGVSGCAKPRSRRFYTFHRCMKSETTQSSPRSLGWCFLTLCPHPETLGCPEQPAHHSKGKGIEPHLEEGCCNGAEPPRMQTLEKVLALHKHITTFSGIQRHLSHFLGKLYLAPFQFRVAFLLS